MKKILKTHGIWALVLGILWGISYLAAQNVHGGLDMIGEAFAAASLVLLLEGAFILNLILLVTDTVIYVSPRSGKILFSYVLLALYILALAGIIYSAFSFSYGKFFQYLKEGEFFSYIHVLIAILLIIMIIVRRNKLKKIRRSS